MIGILNVSKKFRIWEDRSRDLKETAVNWVRGKKRSRCSTASTASKQGRASRAHLPSGRL